MAFEVRYSAWVAFAGHSGGCGLLWMLFRGLRFRFQSPQAQIFPISNSLGFRTFWLAGLFWFWGPGLEDSGSVRVTGVLPSVEFRCVF